MSTILEHLQTLALLRDDWRANQNHQTTSFYISQMNLFLDTHLAELIDIFTPDAIATDSAEEEEICTTCNGTGYDRELEKLCDCRPSEIDGQKQEG